MKKLITWEGGGAKGECGFLGGSGYSYVQTECGLNIRLSWLMCSLINLRRVKLQAQLTQSVRVRKNFILHQLVKQRRYLCSQLLAVKRQIPQKLLTYHRVYQEVMISLWTCQLKKKVILNVLSQHKVKLGECKGLFGSFCVWGGVCTTLSLLFYCLV